MRSELSIDTCRAGKLFDFRLKLNSKPKSKCVRGLVYKPARLDPRKQAVVVMHGKRRAAEKYFASWSRLAEENSFLLIVPKFDRRNWPGPNCYNLGNLIEPDRTPIPRSRSAFTALDRVIEHALSLAQCEGSKFSLYGHSAGAQFVHRYVMLHNNARLTSAVAANAGWYTMPDQNIRFPYGLKKFENSAASLYRSLTTNLTVLVGENDNDTNDPDLRTTSQAMRQGINRLERAEAFYSSGLNAANALGIPFAWRFFQVCGAGHNDQDVSQVALKYLLSDSITSHTQNELSENAFFSQALDLKKVQGQSKRGNCGERMLFA